MRYSEFGSITFFCPSCKRPTRGVLGEGAGPHFRAIHCEHCGKHSSQWLKQRDQSESANPLVDDAVLITKKTVVKEVQFGLFNEMDG